MLSLLVQIMSRKHLCCDCRRFRSSDKWLTQSSFCRSYPNTWSAGHGIRLMSCWRITRSTYPLRVSSPLGTCTRLFPDGAVEENFCHRISHQNLAGFVVWIHAALALYRTIVMDVLIMKHCCQVADEEYPDYGHSSSCCTECVNARNGLSEFMPRRTPMVLLSFGHFWNIFFSCFRCMSGVVLFNDIRALLSYKLVYTGIIVISMETNCCWTADPRNVVVRKLVESTCS